MSEKQHKVRAYPARVTAGHHTFPDPNPDTPEVCYGYIFTHVITGASFSYEVVYPTRGEITRLHHELRMKLGVDLHNALVLVVEVDGCLAGVAPWRTLPEEKKLAVIGSCDISDDAILPLRETPGNTPVTWDLWDPE